MISEDEPTYNGDRIAPITDRLTFEQKLGLLDWHPLFRGRCPECELPIAFLGQREGQWECLECGWGDGYSLSKGSV